MKTKTKQTELYSFDVFDTLITRRVGVPKGIFALMQEEIQGKVKLPKDFYTIRIESERLARELGAYREITFDDIYTKMQEDYDLDNETICYLKDLEIRTELENLVGIEENILKLKTLLEQGERVVLISDMYYSTDTIRMFLSHISPIFEKIRIYVSSEYKTSKYEGKLFKIVEEQENISPKKWLHTGDNKISDIKKAQSLKIQTDYFEFPPLTKYEEELLGLYPENVLYNLIVGASRITRLNKSKNKEKYDFGASLTAPILYNYVNWILEESLKRGFKTLHFIARDGYIPKIIADMIIEKRGLDIKTKYIYGSRLAWRIPCEENYEVFINMMMNEYPYRFTLKLLSERLQLNLKDLNKYFKIEDPDKILTCEERVVLSNIMLTNKELKKFIFDNNINKKKLLLRYIKQEFDILQNKIAFVDISGSGNTQNILCDYINKIYPNTSVYTYFLTSSEPQIENPKSKRYTYCIEPKANYHYFELIARANSGQTLGYKENNGIIEPVLEGEYQDKIQNWGINEYIQGCIDFTKNLLKLSYFNHNVELSYLYHEYITYKCSRNTAQILGDLPFTNVGSEKSVQKTASQISVLNFVKILFFKEKKEKYTEFTHLSRKRSNYIVNILSFIAKQFDIFSDFYSEIKLLHQLNKYKHHKIMLWGASLFLENFLKKYHVNNKNILGVIDKNPNRVGYSVGNYKIYPPSIISTLQPKYILTTVKHRNRTIFYQVNKYLKEHSESTILLPNIFEK